MAGQHEICRQSLIYHRRGLIHVQLDRRASTSDADIFQIVPTISSARLELHPWCHRIRWFGPMRFHIV